MDLLSLIVTLQPLSLSNRPDPPRWWGRAVHALLLQVINTYDPNLSIALHASQPAVDEDDPFPRSGVNAGSPVRPFSVSTLMGRFTQGMPDPAQTYTLRYTSLFKGLSDILWRAVQDGPLAVGNVVELDRLPFRVVGVLPNDSASSQVLEHPWARCATYTSLSAPWLLASEPPPRRLKLRFASPTTFKSGGAHQPLPLPGLVFGNLLERWNAYAPLAFPQEARRYAEECLVVSHYRLSTRYVPLKERGGRIGAVGEVTYITLNYDRYWMSLMTVLAHFALFSGLGAATSLGLGQCRLEPEGPPAPVAESEPDADP